MKRYSAATAKQRLSYLLDAAERGEPVIIQRGGVSFRVQPEPRVRRKKSTRRPIIEILDPAITKGDWVWKWMRGGLSFDAEKKARR